MSEIAMKEEQRLFAALDSLLEAGFSEAELLRTAIRLGLKWTP